jgi:hypothetical protein
MASVVQGKCPGCKTVLVIPAEWARQSVRCQHCGMVVTAQPSTPPPPRAVTFAPSTASPWSDLQEEDAPRRRRRRSGNGWWIGPVVALCILGVAGGLIAANWSRLANLFKGDDNKVIENGDSSTEREGGVGSTNRETSTGKGLFPRRALIVSVHNYLYANPVSGGIPGNSRALNIASLRRKLTGSDPTNSLGNGLHVPANQIAHLSDEADRPEARPPTREAILTTLSDFLDSSRPQDHVLVFFIGHAVEIGDDAFLVPIEGELDNPATLIPLKDVYKKLAECKARQKVLVLDVCRFNPTQGLERPGSGPMGPKFDAALQAPPPGVQVWSSCIAGQRSYETENHPIGAFLEAVCSALDKNLPGTIQRQAVSLPLGKLNETVQQALAVELKPLKLEQTCRLTGQESPEGAGYDPKEAMPPTPTLARVTAKGGNALNEAEIQKVLAEVGTPPVKVSRDGRPVTFDVLPPFPARTLEKYAADSPAEPSALRKAVRDARVVLYAIAGGGEPAELTADVAKVRADLKVNLSVLKDGYRAPANENQFKAQVLKDNQEVAVLLAGLEEALEELKKAGADRNNETKRWQANYDFVLARLEAQLAYLYEYQYWVGQLRKELPPRDPKLHGGWRLASAERLNGDKRGKDLAKDARKILDGLIERHPKTPWEVLAKREKLTALGLEWQPAK